MIKNVLLCKVVLAVWNLRVGYVSQCKSEIKIYFTGRINLFKSSKYAALLMPAGIPWKNLIEKQIAHILDDFS
jgi:hypothetical protein